MLDFRKAVEEKSVDDMLKREVLNEDSKGNEN